MGGIRCQVFLIGPGGRRATLCGLWRPCRIEHLLVLVLLLSWDSATLLPIHKFSTDREQMMRYLCGLLCLKLLTELGCPFRYFGILW